MKKSIVIVLACFVVQNVFAQDFNKSMVEIMENMKTYTLEIVDLMPEEKFDYRPTDSVRTFGEQVQHVIRTNHFFLNYYLKGNEGTDRKEAIQRASSYVEKTEKSELVRLLKEQFDENISFFGKASKKRYAKNFDFGTPKEPVVKDYFATSMLIRDHVSHHRAQLTIYLRLNGIQPVRFRGF